MCLTSRVDPSEFVGLVDSVEGQEFVFSEEDAEDMSPGVIDLLEKPCPLLIEKQVDFGFGFGTVDAAYVSPGRTHVYVNDFKSGGGHSVSPVENRQLMLYAAGLIMSDPEIPDYAIVSLVIDQPLSGGIKVWETKVAHIMEFHAAMECVVRGIEDGQVSYAPSDDNCRWCPVMANCPEMSKRNLQLFGFKGKEPKLPKLMTARQRSKILKYREQIENWLKTLHDEAMADALAGKKVPGFKVVEGRVGNRRWADEVAAEIELQKTLGDKAYTTKLISPAQAEKKLGNQIPSTIQPPGKPILVDEDDKRPSMVLFDGN